MKIIRKCENDGPVLIEPNVYKDDRGYFFESFNEKEFREKVADVAFVQDNESRSSYGVLRGLHFQKPPYDQAKLVRVVKGAVFDVAVDIRKDSPTYGTWYGAYLTANNHRQFFIPRGFAHGFVALDDDNVFQYKCDNLYNKESEGGLQWNDETINIPWKEWINTNDIILSEKDKNREKIETFVSPFNYFADYEEV